MSRARTAMLRCGGCLWLLAACGDDSAAMLEPGVLELGTGEVSFESLARGEHAALHAGTQGGHHVWLSMRVTGLQPEGILFTLDVIPREPAPPAHTEVELDFEPVQGRPDEFEFVGWPARVLAAECAVDRPVELVVRLEDAMGRTAQASTEIIADPPLTGFPVPCSTR